MTLEEKLIQIIEQGFDDSSIDEDAEAVLVRCSRCEAAIINGIATHEHGCSNWIRYKINSKGSDCERRSLRVRSSL